jgi:uncharacterized protein (UPF0548 family)
MRQSRKAFELFRMFLTRRPAPQKIKEFLERSQNLPLSYEPVGIAQESPRGFKIDEASSVIGQGVETFARAKQALTNWTQFELGWVELHPPGAPIKVGTVVGVLVRHLGFWSLNGCRVVYLLDEDEMKYGFAYGTLANHAELGEEIFEVSLDPGSQEVTYRIRAVSKAHAAAARLGYPYTRFLQERFRRDSITAMRRALGTHASGVLQ